METKLRRGIFLAFGITFVLIVAMIVVWKLKFYDDVTQQIGATQIAYKTATDTAATLDRELKDAAIAKENLVLAQDELDYFRRRFRSLSFDLTPSPGEGARNRTWLGYMNEYFSNYGLEVRRQLVRAADETGVVLASSLKIDAPPQVPENVVAPPSGFLKPVTGGFMSVTLTGDLGSILRFLERVNRSPILMTVGAIKLEGASPAITATFTITPYLVGTGPSIALPVVAPAAPAEGAVVPGAPGDPNIAPLPGSPPPP